MHPLTVRVLSALAVSSSCAYFVGVFLAFSPGWDTWNAHFVPLVLPYVWPPIMLVLLYMYARSNMGHMLLKRGREDEALAYTQAHWSPTFWWIGKAEALGHRAVALRILIRRGEYERAREALSVPQRHIKGKEAYIFSRWAVEVLLRTEDLVEAKSWEAKAQRGSGKPAERAALYAALSQAWSRGDQLTEAQRLLDEAVWSDEDAPRVAQTRAWDHDHAALFELPEALFEAIPGQRAEWLVLCWQHAESCGHDPARWRARLDEELATTHPDQRSRHVAVAAGVDA